MLEKLQVFQLAQGMARHAAARQAIIAQNVANADTPGYRAQDIAPFQESYRAQGTPGLKATRVRHDLGAGFSGDPSRSWTPREATRPGALSPNGNNVSLEAEMMAAAETQRKQGLALAIYRSSLNILRSSLGRG